MNNDQVILHHYPQSPVSEKVRCVLGMKVLAWRSVLIPRLPPKPNLMALTGGYRLTPVMQIGADVYCDTKCIIHELERRFPHPTPFLSPVAGAAWGTEQWTDDALFQDVFNVAIVEMSATMPPEFLADRGPLYFGPDFTLDGIKATYDECLAKVGVQFRAWDEQLKSNAYLQGAAPGLVDALAYYFVWLLHDRMADGEAFLGAFENLVAWERRIKDLGHGNPVDMSDLEALDIAKHAEPQTPEHSEPNSAIAIDIGHRVIVESTQGGAQVAGTLHSVTPENVAILRSDEQVGRMCVHFPRLGYNVARA